MAMPNSNSLPLGTNPEGAWNLQAGLVYAAVGICSLGMYPVGALLLETKCGWTCMPTVSDVERPLTDGADASGVDFVRRGLVVSAVFMRVILVPLMLVQIYYLMKSPRLSNRVSRLLEIVFHASLGLWIFSDLWQLTIGNSLEHRSDYTPHTTAAHIDISALIICHMVLLAILYNDDESGRHWLGVSTLALMKVSVAALFLAIRLSTISNVWQLVEWAMLGSIGVLHVSVGLAMPPTLKMSRDLKVFRLNSTRMLPGYNSMERNCSV